MAKTLIAQSIPHFNPLEFVMDGSTVVGFTCNVEVNYGERGITETLDLWSFLNANQKQAVQQFHDLLRQKLEAYYL